MKKALNYTFESRSTSYLDWLYNVVRSEKYFKEDAATIMEDITKSYLPQQAENI